MSRMTKKQAEAEAKVLAAMSGWEPRVWENMGWHAEAHYEDFSLHRSVYKMPSGKTDVRYFICGPAIYCREAEGKTVQEAMDKLRRNLIAVRDEAQVVLNKLAVALPFTVPFE